MDRYIGLDVHASSCTLAGGRTERKTSEHARGGDECGSPDRGATRDPEASPPATLTIALGLGANTAIFSVLRAVVLTPLPFEAPENVVALRNASVDNPLRSGAFSFPQLEDFATRHRAFAGVSAFQFHQPTLTERRVIRLDASGASPRSTTSCRSSVRSPCSAGASPLGTTWSGGTLRS